MASVIPKTKDSPMRRNQTSKVMMAAMSATNVRMPAARSAIFCDLGFVARASLMSCFICPTVECSPTLARVMVRAPSTQIEPAVTLSPCFFETGFGLQIMSEKQYPDKSGNLQVKFHFQSRQECGGDGKKIS